MRSPIENRFGLPALVLVALLALYGTAAATRSPAAPAPVPRPERVPVASVTAVCPAPGEAAVGVLTPPGDQAPGTASLVAAGRTLAAVNVPGRLWREEVPASSSPLVVTASGSMASGLEVSQTRRETSGGQRGLAGVRCTEPVASTWLIGPGPSAADVTLHLSNADPAPAVAEVVIYSGEGPVITENGNVFTLKPGENRTIRMRDLAPSALVMAIEVRTASGRVTAAARALMNGGRGVDWLPVSAAPATRVVVPGIPGGGGRRELLVASPAEADTLVEIKALTPEGTYALKDRELVEVPAGSVAALDLAAGIGGQPAALLLTADTPFVAGLVATGTGARTDVAFTAGADPVDLGSVVAENRVDGATTSRLLLTASQAAGSVSVQVVPGTGEAHEPFQVDIPAARTAQVALPKIKGTFAVVVRPLPGSGPVHGGRVLEERLKGGAALTVQPLAMARIWALVPPMAESAAIVLP
ncbi:DUF5719 family protein [Streptosporangium sp. NPDC023615]|uniref:DUF5719 family protein n=1 Tax=Streptosporangium sp. NPDC023615 TaxID=3154794 RepID=UPI003427F38D